MNKQTLYKTMKTVLAMAMLGGMLTLGQDLAKADSISEDTPTIEALTIQVEGEKQKEAAAKAAVEAKAAAQGYEVGTTPKVGAVIVWTDGGYGHVGVVTEVGENGLIQIVESNYNGNMTVANYRGFFNPLETGAGTVSYIYPPAGV
ncbi:TPA: CHAP domain-containing protein [Streptococcus suis]|nr:CHAP domain-containing protein [Streptococcus suis]